MMNNKKEKQNGNLHKNVTVQMTTVNQPTLTTL